MPDREFATLHEIMVVLAAEQDSTRLLDRIADNAAVLLGAPVSGVYLYDEAKKELCSSALHGCAVAPFGARVALDAHFPGVVAIDRDTLVLNSNKDGDSFLPAWKEAGLAAIIATAMIYREELVGIVFAAAPEPALDAFGADASRLLRFLAAQAAICIRQLGLLEQLRAERARGQFLSRRLLQAYETDAYQLGGQLQDEIGQALAGVQINLQLAQPQVSEPFARASLERSRVTVERTLEQVRDIALRLRPAMLDEFGLVPALRWLIQRYAKSYSYVVEFVADALEPRPPVEIESTCFRIVQQVLGNLARREFEGIVQIKLERAGADLDLRIEYAGCETDEDPEQAANALIGFEGLQERAILVGGSFETVSEAGSGTRLHATFPVAAPDAFVEPRARRKNTV